MRKTPYLLPMILSTGGALGQLTVGPFTDSSTNNGATPTGVTNQYDLTGFDTSLGELTSVRLSYMGSMQQQGSTEVTSGSGVVGPDGFVSNLDGRTGRGLLALGVNSPGGPGYDGSQNPTAIWGDPAIFLLDDIGTLTIGALAGTPGDTIPADGTIDFAGTSGDASGFQDLVVLNSVLDLTSPADLVFFENPTVMLFDYQAGASSMVGPGNVTNFVQTTGMGEVSVEYTYTPVPEPASSTLALISVFGFAFRRRRSA